MGPDPATIALAQRGSTDAQALILRLCSGSLRGLIRRLGSPGELEDQLQDLYLKILAALPRYRIGGPATFNTWVTAVGHHWLLDQRRRFRPRLVPLSQADAVSHAEGAADQAVEDGELRAALDRELQRLPELQRRVFVLASFHHQPLEEIARIEGVPLGTVKSRLHRARAELVLALGARLDARKGGRRASAL